MKKTIMFLFAAATAVTLCSMTDAAGSKAMSGHDSLSTAMIHDSSLYVNDSAALPKDSTAAYRDGAALQDDSLLRAMQDTSRRDTTRRDTTRHGR